MLPADQKSFLKLVFGLHVDINCLLQSINYDPSRVDEKVIFEFHRGLVDFLRKSCRSVEVLQGLLVQSLPGPAGDDAGDEKSFSSPLNPAVSVTRSASVTGSTIPPFPQRCASLVPYPRPFTEDNESVYQESTGAFSHSSDADVSDTPICHAPSSAAPTQAYTAAPFRVARFGHFIPAQMRTPQFGRFRNSHSLWISSAPPELTCSVLSQSIFGGPLESLESFRNRANTQGIAINFLYQEDAASFLAFSKTPMGGLRFPVPENPQRHLKLKVQWNDRQRVIRPDILMAAEDAEDPARRVLIFWDYPMDAMGEEELRERLFSLWGRNGGRCSVEKIHMFPGRKQVVVVFDKIEAAIIVKLSHQRRLLGSELQRCRVVYGRDPCERPIPGSEDSRVGEEVEEYRGVTTSTVKNTSLLAHSSLLSRTPSLASPLSGHGTSTVVSPGGARSVVEDPVWEFSFGEGFGYE